MYNIAINNNLTFIDRTQGNASFHYSSEDLADLLHKTCTKVIPTIIYSESIQNTKQTLAKLRKYMSQIEKPSKMQSWKSMKAIQTSGVAT